MIGVNVLSVDALVGVCRDDLRELLGSVVVISSVYVNATTPGVILYSTSKAA